METSDIRQRVIDVNGIHLNIAEAGPEEGPLVLLLHGFPEFWYSWHKQIPALADAGFHVIAPDQRGYNLSDKPKWMVGYRLDTLVEDMATLIRQSAHQKAMVVGHDWGGAVAWGLAMQHPLQVTRLVPMNTAPPQVMFSYARRHLSQAVKSLYILAFQIPWLPERLWRSNNFRRGVRALTQTSRPGTFSEADLQAYRQAWSKPGAQNAMLNWYRASLRFPFKRHNSRVSMPVRILWGRQDAFLNAQLAEESLKLCDQGEVLYFENATHWLHHEEAGEVSRQLIEFFSP